MSNSKIKAKYLSLSEEENALDYLEQAYNFIKQTENDNFSWKWVIIALHGALYGFAICALKGTNPDRVTYTTKSGKKLISFNEALKRCQKPKYMNMLVTSKCLQLTDAQKESIHYLKDTFRNNFEHFVPKSWYIELHGMPKIVIDVLDVIRFIALDTGNYIDLTEKQRKRVESIVFQSKEILKMSTLYKESELSRKKSSIK
ncbi:MAG: hypothetical protein WBA71_04660 [Candidatus Humimicrobiia bacterium]